MTELEDTFSGTNANEILDGSVPAGEIHLYAFAAILEWNIHFTDLDDNGKILTSFVYQSEKAQADVHIQRTGTYFTMKLDKVDVIEIVD